MSIKLDGVNQILQQVASMGKKLEQSTKEKALKSGGTLLKKEIEKGIQSKDLVLTGNWRDSIIVSEIKNDTVDVGADQQGQAFYGHFHEFGTSKMKATPVYGPAFEDNKEAVQEEMSRVIKEDLGL